MVKHEADGTNHVGHVAFLITTRIPLRLEAYLSSSTSRPYTLGNDDMYMMLDQPNISNPLLCPPEIKFYFPICQLVGYLVKF